MDIVGRKEGRTHKSPWTIHVEAEALGPFYGPRAGNEKGELSIKDLLPIPDANTKKLLYKALSAQVEQFTQAGKANEAADLIKEYLKTQQEYKSPYYVFQKDMQNGGAPYLGAYCYFGAFRDAAKELFTKQFWGKGNTEARTAKILKTYVPIRPYHIFFHRGKKKIGRDEIVIEDNNPTPDVKGFAFYERIDPPFNFGFSINVLTDGPFSDTLRNEDKVLEVLRYSIYKGLGAKRGQGGGYWRPSKIKIEASAKDL